MSNPYGAPEIDVEEVAAARKDRPGEILFVDVREPFELTLAAIAGEDVVLAPLSELSSRGIEALPDDARAKDREIVVFCHHGIRSAQVTMWLLQQGWSDVRSMAGGIDVYAQRIDPSVGAYE
jgi:rhodanese-related sulfurtransferase